MCRRGHTAVEVPRDVVRVRAVDLPERADGGRESGGALLWLASWQSLRRGVRALCRTTEAVFAIRHTGLPQP
jgi:hypothetical protein